MPTPQQTARKWQSRLKGATTEIREGVQAVERSPMEAAASNPEKWLNGVQQSAVKWANRLRAVPLETWKQRTVDIGIGRIPAGVDAAVSDMEGFFGELADYQTRIDRELNDMADVTLEDAIARMTHQVRRMSEFSRS